jgi:G3E family GTPase
VTSDPPEGRIRITLLGGFLGAGKSTWLRHSLRAGSFLNAAVVVNEAAAVVVDDVLLSGEASVRTLAGGCACCEKRADLVELLRSVCDERVALANATRRVDEIVLETSGLADPGRIVGAIAADPVLQHHIVMGEIIVTVDALHGLAQIQQEPLGRRQIESADRLVVAKVDAAEPEPLRRLVATLRTLNPGGALSGAALGAPVDLPDMNGAEPYPLLAPNDDERPISAVSLDLGEDLDWPTLAVWLSALIHARGEDILRIKGVVNTQGRRLLFQSVHKVVQPPEILPGPPALARHDNMLAMIGRGLSTSALSQSWRAFRRMADGAADSST